MFAEITIIGRLGGDPEMRFTPDGTPVTSFSVATSRTVSKDRTPDCPGGWKESYNGKNWELTTWFRVSAWRGLAELTNQYLNKGSEVFIRGELAGEAANGSLNPRVWTGNDGTPRASFEVTARTVKFLGSRSSNGFVPQEPPDSSAEGQLPF